MEKLKSILNPQFEVEIRCHFDTADDAYKVIPFLHSCLRHEMVWSSSFYGQEFFKSGQLLRMSKTTVDNKTKYYLGWKGCDTGTFANIREELDEVITDGIIDSQILRKLGTQKRTLGRKDITAELKLLGHHKFMSFRGYDLFGNYEPLDVSMKLMTCRSLKWPVLVEVEKAATTREEALIREAELREFCDRFGLHDRLVREEPPTLLYATRFHRE
jgi:adenylate cyclase class IV